MRSMMATALAARLLRVVPVGVPLMVRCDPRSCRLCRTWMMLALSPHLWARKRLRCSLDDAMTALLCGDGLPPPVTDEFESGLHCDAERVHHAVVVALGGARGWSWSA